MMLAQLERNVDGATGLLCAGKLAGGEYVRQSGGMADDEVCSHAFACCSGFNEI